MIKAVLFDFGQTLVDSADGFRTAEKDAETKVFQDLGVESWSEFLSKYREFRKDFHAQSNFSRKALWQKIYLYHNRKPDLEYLSQAERDYWNTVKSKTKPFPEAKAVLEQLAPAYRLALITNGQGQDPSEKHRLSLFPELETFFEVVIVAGEVGVPPKPKREPFLLCLERLGIAPAEAIFVGDDWRIDVCGARDVGIQPVWLQHRSVSRRWPTVETSVPIITGLEQLFDLHDVGISCGGAYDRKRSQ